MSYFVYILLSLKDKKLYVGCTTNLEKRLIRHNNGAVFATKSRRPLELIYSEKFESKTEAFNRERFLKSLWGARFKKKVLDKYKQSRASHSYG
ncbi:MAG: GIY-YIG nuclease family protein [Candidatus Zambryskibacteria bacterium]|nr:GIY-YIG nuclease family protein [Candidatus Zambryskibacteria bacterium]